MVNKKQVLVNADARPQDVLAMSLFAQGNKIAEKFCYRKLSGIDAVRYYLVQKHNWLPSQVNGMSCADLSFCLKESEFD
jgi:hypothetical protein